MRKILIVGTGFAGATIANRLADNNYFIDIIDSRSHIAGNAYDFKNKNGIRIHKYGPHIFHTSNMNVVNYLSNFTQWTPYKHKVKAMLDDGSFVTLPVNIETAKKVGSKNIIEIFYRPYSEKMWGMKLEDIDPSIFSRVPIRNDLNEYYFPKDKFQAMPLNGYTNLIRKMLDHPNIKIYTKNKFEKDIHNNYFHTFNSMSIDEYFDFEFGKLPYRSIKFHNFNYDIDKIYPVATINFTDNSKFTRVTEWKNFPNNIMVKNNTAITFEEPCSFEENNYERYYPIKDLKKKNRNLYFKYKKKCPQNMTFIGRCGLYVYLDMHQAVMSSLNIASKFIIDHQ